MIGVGAEDNGVVMHWNLTLYPVCRHKKTLLYNASEVRNEIINKTSVLQHINKRIYR